MVRRRRAARIVCGTRAAKESSYKTRGQGQCPNICDQGGESGYPPSGPSASIRRFTLIKGIPPSSGTHPQRPSCWQETHVRPLCILEEGGSDPLRVCDQFAVQRQPTTQTRQACAQSLTTMVVSPPRHHRTLASAADPVTQAPRHAPAAHPATKAWQPRLPHAHTWHNLGAEVPSSRPAQGLPQLSITCVREATPAQTVSSVLERRSRMLKSCSKEHPCAITKASHLRGR